MANLIRPTITAFKQAQKATPSSMEGLAFSCMVNNVSYRLNQMEAKDPLIGLKVLVRTLKKIKQGGTCWKCIDNTSKSAILESGFVFEELETKYVSKLSGQTPGYFISKEDLPRSLNGKKGLISLVLFGLSKAISCLLSSKNRGSKAMHITFIAENAGLKNTLEELRINQLYDFAPYLIDSNFAYFLCKSEDLVYAKLPSPGPLSTHHHVLFCDDLILSSPYQFEELKTLPNVSFSTQQKWIPEYGFTYIDQYQKDFSEAPIQTIGYYSHGGWLRESEGHADDGLNIPQAEAQLLTDLGTILTSEKQFKLIVFPHPREKKEAVWEQTKAHYQTYFGELTNVEIVQQGVQTSKAFNQVDIAVAAFSTILYERLFCGFKTFIGNYGMNHFPLPNSSLETICFNNETQLKELLVKASQITRKDFFQEFGLKPYHFTEYPYFQQT
ncbi:MAG: hypothetical protein ACJAU0_000359 [Flavobacteriales bacterium]|jgi:hypothetical protein